MTGTTTATSSPPIVALPARVGNPATDGNFAFTVLGSDTDDVIHFDKPDAVYAQGIFVLVTTTVANVGRIAQTYMADYQRLVDSEGRVYSPDRRAMWTGGYIEQSRIDINPGNKTAATLIFDVPKGSKPNQYLLSLRSQPGSAGVKLSIPALQPPTPFAPTAADDQRFLQQLAADTSRYPAITPQIGTTNPASLITVAHEYCYAVTQKRHMSSDDIGVLGKSLAQRWNLTTTTVLTVGLAAQKTYRCVYSG